MNSSQSPVDVAVAFINTLADKDMETAAGYVADDVVFEGPMSRFTESGPYLKAMGEFAQAVVSVDIIATVGDEDRATVVYEMHTGPFGTVRALEYFVVADGKIKVDTLVFDTYEIRKAMEARPPAE